MLGVILSSEETQNEPHGKGIIFQSLLPDSSVHARSESTSEEQGRENGEKWIEEKMFGWMLELVDLEAYC